MVEDKYSWKITLFNDKVKEETKDTFNLDWEVEGKVKQIELVGEHEIIVNLETGEFNINGIKQTPDGSVGYKSLFFRKRRKVKLEGIRLPEIQTTYLVGYVVDNKKFLATIRPKTSVCNELLEHGKLII